MIVAQTEALAPVDAGHLETAFEKCVRLFSDADQPGLVNADDVLSVLNKAFPLLATDEVLDLFRRVCLSVQLLADIDSRWEKLENRGARPKALPAAFFELVATETAFGEVTGGTLNTFFARDVLDEAICGLRPH